MLVGGNEAGCLERGRVAIGQDPKVSGARVEVVES